MSLWRGRILRPITWAAALIGSLDMAIFSYQHGARIWSLPGVAGFGLLTALWWSALSESISVRVRAWTTVGVLYAAATLALLTMGLSAGGLMALFGFVSMTALLLGRRAVFAAFALTVTTIVLMALAFHEGVLHVVEFSVLDPGNLWNWLRVGAFGTGIAGAIGGATIVLLDELSSALAERIALVEQLRREADERERAMSQLAEAQERLLHAHKLEAVGRLAGGIAHDFNNTLTVILSYAELLKARLGRGHALGDLAEQVIQAAEQGGDLTKQLLTFSRRQILKPRVVDAQQQLKQTERALSRLIPKSVRVHRAVATEDLCVFIDPTLLQQVLLNLALNARDAMPQGGDLYFEIASAELQGAGPSGNLSGPYVVLSVRDTGTGMSPEVLARSFEPFFTTKEPGLGTGLGLSNVRETVEAAGGYVTVESEPNKGSKFTLYFPRVDARVSSAETAIPGTPAREARVIVVDDEPQIREVIRTMLVDSGYAVSTAESAGRALELLAHEPVDLVCTDLVMPDVSGGKLIDDIRRKWPKLPVVVCSAYGTDESVSQRVARGDVHFLPKPFARKDLLKVVERALDPRSAEGKAEAPRAAGEKP